MINTDFALLADESIDEINESLRLIQKKGGLKFGTDAYLLSAFVRGKPGKDAADLGSGTGVAALLCQSKQKFRTVYAVELQKSFAELIGRNAALNQMEERVIPVLADVRDLTSAMTGGELHAVFSNPPYMMCGSGLNNATAEMNMARREQNGTIADFAACAARLLRFGGFFYCVYRPDRLSDLMAALRGANLEPKRMILVYPDTESKPSLVLLEAKKGAAPGLTVAAPLIVYRSGNPSGQRSYTDNMNRVYEEFSLDFLFHRT